MLKKYCTFSNLTARDCNFFFHNFIQNNFLTETIVGYFSFFFDKLINLLIDFYLWIFCYWKICLMNCWCHGKCQQTLLHVQAVYLSDSQGSDMTDQDKWLGSKVRSIQSSNCPRQEQKGTLSTRLNSLHCLFLVFLSLLRKYRKLWACHLLKLNG